ncbi:glutathione S-transferase family protein [Microvirga calopogonii]|uniref:glutathione S-transferase family protein n=1 Tax=Microvirga calopogonii TaxID=2078013 RepID=UPI000E0DC49E|nr:glutathione binding-like protein [Microvirga calopogonii]
MVGTTWWSEDRFEQADVLSWISFQQSSLMLPLAQLRLHRARHPHRFVDPQMVKGWEQQAGQALGCLNDRLSELSDSDWLATAGHPSVADVVVYPYTRLARIGGIDLEVMPAVGKWLQRFESLPNYSPLIPGHPELNESTVEML